MYIPIWIIVMIVITCFFWIKNRKESTPPLSNKNTSLNPLFSEKQISDSKDLFTNWQKKLEESFDTLQKKEVEEIKIFPSKKEYFKPSDNLLNTIGKQTLIIFCKNCAKQDYEKMIESNISIINGEKISSVENRFYDNSNRIIPYHDLNIVNDWELYKEIFEKEYKKNVTQRKKYWNTSWDSIRREEN